MLELREARKNLEAVLSEEQLHGYFGLVKVWMRLWQPSTKIQFGAALRKLLRTEEQVHCHNRYILALANTRNAPRAECAAARDRGTFELADYTDYIAPASPLTPTLSFANRSAAAEFFLPDTGFIAAKIELHAWENQMDGADDKVAGYLVFVCQTFVKNILTAMISRKESYKLRDGNFQYGFGFPLPDPLVRNAHNIIDRTQESKVEIADDGGDFVLGYKPTMENVEQETAFAYSCGKRQCGDEKLSVRLLHETLRENPRIIGLHSVHGTNLLKVGLQLDET